MELQIPRDRAGTFEPLVVPKHARRVPGFDEAILSLYAKGLTTGEIQAHMHDVYGADISRDFVSKVTDAVNDELTSWRNRPLDRIYAVVFIDAIMIKIRDGAVANRPVYVAVGVNLDGERDVLGRRARGRCRPAIPMFTKPAAASVAWAAAAGVIILVTGTAPALPKAGRPTVPIGSLPEPTDTAPANSTPGPMPVSAPRSVNCGTLSQAPANLLKKQQLLHRVRSGRHRLHADGARPGRRTVRGRRVGCVGQHAGPDQYQADTQRMPAG